MVKMDEMVKILKAADLLAEAVQKYGRGEIHIGDLGQDHAFWEAFREEFIENHPRVQRVLANNVARSNEAS